MGKRVAPPHQYIAWSPDLKQGSAVTGSDFDSLATAFSVRLKEIEEKLERDVGKTEAKVEFLHDGTAFYLEWTRAGGAWNLWIAAKNSQKATALSQCSVEAKIAASNALPPLIEKIRLGEAERVQRLREAHAHLDRVTAMINPREGK